jgi:hypothetical protein
MFISMVHRSPIVANYSPNKTPMKSGESASPPRHAVVGIASYNALAGLCFNIRERGQWFLSEIMITKKTENNRLTKSKVHKTERFKKVVVVKEFIIEEEDETNSPHHQMAYDNLDGSISNAVSPMMNGSPDDVLRTTS